MENKKYSNKELLRKFIPFYRKYKKIFIMDMLAAVLTVVSELTLPLIIRNITNLSAVGIENITLNYIVTIAFIYLLLKLLEISANYFMQKNGHIMGAMIERDMRKKVFAHVQYLSDEFFNNTKIGQLMARITTDLFDVTEFAHHGPEEFLVAAVKILVSFIILININITLTLVIFCILPLMFALTRRVRKKIRNTNKSQRHQIGEINSSIEDSLLGIKVIKSFANEEIEIKKFDEDNKKFLNLKRIFYSNLSNFQVITRALDAFMYITVLLLGTFLLSKGTISSGDFVMYIMYVTSLLTTVKKIVDFTETYEKGMTGIERFVELMDVSPKIKDRDLALELHNVKGNIEFDNVSFSYRKEDRFDKYYDEKLVLKDISLSINNGENIAIVGPSGGGKTTLTNLIPRFYDVNEGSVKIDGVDIRDIKLSSLRDNIGIVQQDVYLFSGSILDNIRYGKPDASIEDIEKAADLAGARDFIDELPDGFDTYVGERGLKLSGGQKQRISIARVFLKNPPILILDEATSALDNKSEKIIQESLDKLSKGRTTITIAHRLTTIINADKILVLTDQGIVEQGSHEALLAQRGEYYNLYNTLENHTIG